jgi:hypothetical protein
MTTWILILTMCRIGLVNGTPTAICNAPTTIEFSSYENCAKTGNSYTAQNADVDGLSARQIMALTFYKAACVQK